MVEGGLMPGSRVELAQAGQGVEALKEGFGRGGKIGPPAHAVEPREEAASSPVQHLAVGVVYEAVGFEVFEVLEKLLSVEVREGPTRL
jgi:hypothetical protein